jgi:outer membrane biosynthesis protein TonB
MLRRHVLDRIELLIDGELGPDDEQIVRAHLAECPSCRHSYRMALAVQAHFGPAADPEAPSSLLPSVMARVAQRRRRGATTVLVAAAISTIATVSMVVTALAGPAGITGLLPGAILATTPFSASPESARRPEVAGVPALGQLQPSVPVPAPPASRSPAPRPQEPAAAASSEPWPSPTQSPEESPTPSPTPTPSPSPSPTPTPSPSPTPFPCLSPVTGLGTGGALSGKTGGLPMDCVSPAPIERPGG